VSSLNQHSHSFSFLPLFSFLIFTFSFLFTNRVFFFFPLLYAHKYIVFIWSPIHSTALYLPISAPPNVGVQKSTLVSLATGNVLEIGTKHSPRLLRSCFGPSEFFTLSQSFKHTNIQYFKIHNTNLYSECMEWNHSYSHIHYI